MVKQKCFTLKKFYFIGTLIFSISLQQEISAMVKQKCLYKVLLHRNSNTFSFSATRNHCNGETEMSLLQFYFIESQISSISLQQEISAMVKQKCLYKVLFHRNSDIFYCRAMAKQTKIVKRVKIHTQTFLWDDLCAKSLCRITGESH